MEESRETEEYIKQTGIQKDNGMLEADLTGAAAYQDEISQSQDAKDVLALLEKDEADARERNEDGRQEYESCDLALIYLDEDNALGMSINHNSVIDNTTNTEQVYPLYSYFYYVKENGVWKLTPDLMMLDTMKAFIYEKYMPEGFADAYHAERNWCLYRESFWVGTGAVFENNIKIETGAAWQNADGSVDIYVLCRNGTDRLSAEYSYWVMLEDDQENEIVKGWGYLDADKVILEAGTVKGYLVHFDADEVMTGTEVWPDFGMLSFVSGNNSNYQ